MSLLSRKRGVAAAGIASIAACATAGAAEVWYQPVVTLSSSYNTNVDLDPVDRQTAVGYFADVATNIDIATRTSENVIQPRLLYNYYPSVTRRNRLEAFLNSYSRYQWQRDKFTLVGFFDHRDDANAEQVGATTNPVNPGVGEVTPGTGHTQVGTTRNYLIIDPTWSHTLTPLSSIGIAAEYQGMRYSPASAGHLDFNYYQGRLFYAKTIDLRTDFAIGAYGSRYQSTTIDSKSTSGGVQLNGGYNWTQVLRSDLTVAWQHTKFEETDPRVQNSNSNPWSADLSTVYKQQTSSYRVTIGRTIYPSSSGGLFATDQIRGQYDRDLTQRMHFTGAVRAFRDRTTVGGSGNDRRTYVTGFVRLEYLVTPTIFIAGNYTYIYQKYQFDVNSANANIAQIQFGYRGLERPH
jgi:hypothetical protein